MDVLLRIKSAVVRGNVAFTEKARLELEDDNLLESDVLESILNADSVRTKRSTSRFRRLPEERVCIALSLLLSPNVCPFGGVRSAAVGA